VNKPPPPGADGQAQAKLPYEYDALPREALDLLSLGKITLLDVAVLLTIVRYRKGGNTFSWVTNGTIRKHLEGAGRKKRGLSEPPVHRSLRRLAAAKLIRKRPK